MKLEREASFMEEKLKVFPNLEINSSRRHTSIESISERAPNPSSRTY
jgi:hypothetical protein